MGFGILDWKGNLLHTCCGHNWEVGGWQCETGASSKAQYWALGSNGLKELEDRLGHPDAYIHYGERLCHFLGRDLVPIFHPKIIGLSGGIVAAHYKEIDQGIRLECAARHYRDNGGPLDGVDIYLSKEKDSVMRGLADLLDQDRQLGLRRIINSMKVVGKQRNELLRKLAFKAVGNINALRNCKNWAETIPVNRQCALLAVHVGQVVCADDGGKASLIANRRTMFGKGKSFALIKNDDGSFSLKSAANDKYVSTHPLPDGRLIAEGPKVDAWEKFDVKEVPGKAGVFTLWSRITQKYVSVDENAGNILVANRDVADTWEEFRFFCQ